MTSNRSYAELLSKAPGFAAKSARRWLARRYREVYFRRNDDHDALDGERALRSVRRADDVLFLCWGNICRSPLAEQYLRHRLDEHGINDVSVQSAGLGERDGRSSPDAAIRAARPHDVELDDHESRRVTADDVAESDVVFVMDYNNFHSAVTRFPAVDGDEFFLAAVLDDGSDHVVPDPYGAGEERFRGPYGVITDAIDVVVDAIADERGG